MKKTTYLLKNKKILITGAAGVIGRELVNLLKEQGAIIRKVDIMEKPDSFQGVEYFQCDLSHPNQQFTLHFEPEYVFHLAADFERSTESLSFWDDNFSNNILASHFLLKQISTSKTLKKIIFASSYLIYDPSLYANINRDNILSEDHLINPRNLCGIAKLQTERDIEFLNHQSNNRFSYALVRIFRVYGKDSRDIITRWVRAGLRGEPLKIFDKNNSFDYIMSTDVARGLIKIAIADKAKGIINLGGGKRHTIAEVAKYIKNNIPKSRFVNVNESIYPEASRADIDKLKKTTHWAPAISLSEGIKQIVHYEKQKIKKDRAL